MQHQENRFIKLSVFSMLPTIREETYWSLAESVNHLITTQMTVPTYHGFINWENERVTTIYEPSPNTNSQQNPSKK